MRDFRNLKVWEKAHRLAVALYSATRAFPKDEAYGLTGQLRRSASSIGANIAEGCGREGDAEFGRFLQVAMGSASELENHLLLARDLKLLSASSYDQLEKEVTEVKRMLASFIKRVRPRR